jgi:hypothetical protein
MKLSGISAPGVPEQGAGPLLIRHGHDIAHAGKAGTGRQRAWGRGPVGRPWHLRLRYAVKGPCRQRRRLYVAGRHIDAEAMQARRAPRQVGRTSLGVARGHRGSTASALCALIIEALRDALPAMPPGLPEAGRRPGHA